MALLIAAKAACTPRQLEDRISKGFNAVEVITFENQLKQSFRQMQTVLAKYSKSLEIVSIHAPSELTISDAIDENCRKRGLWCLEKTIELAGGIDCKRVVFHAFQNVTKLGSINEMIFLRDRAFRKCVESIRSLEHLCEESCVTLCLENINACVCLNQVFYPIFTASPHDLLRVVKDVNLNFLRLCFDIAHAQNVSNFILKYPETKALFNVDKLTPQVFCELVIDYVALIHLSDAKDTMATKQTDNLPLGTGEVDFASVLKVILKRAPKIPAVLEIGEDDVDNATNMAKSKELLLHMMAKLKPR